MIGKLRRKFVFLMMSWVTVMIIIIFSLMIGFTADSLETQNIRTMKHAVNISAEPKLSLAENTRLPYLVVRINHSGDIISTYAEYFVSDDWEFASELVQASIVNGNTSGVLRDYKMRFIVEDDPSGTVYVFADITNEWSAIINMIRNSILIGTVCFFLCLGISHLLARWAVKPMEQAWHQQKQFIADASHELKTPLTVVITNTEMLLDSGPITQTQRQFSENILIVSKQMKNMVENLLELARIDNGASLISRTLLDMSQLVTEELLSLEPLFFEQNLTLVSTVEPAIYLNGSLPHLMQVLGILTDNAMKYSIPEGRVEVTLKKQNRNCILSVSNPGQPIPREELKHIFKRFYQVDKSRNRKNSFGLGLSIAHRIVEYHQGRIWAESRNGTNTFYVQLPLK